MNALDANKMIYIESPGVTYGVHVEQLLYDIYKVSPLDPRVTDETALRKWAVEIRNIDGYSEQKNHWRTTSSTSKMAFLRRIHQLQMSFLVFKPIPLIEETADPCDPLLVGVSSGGYDPLNQTIVVNLHLNSARTLDDVVLTIIHEGAHHWQTMIAQKLEQGAIATSDPRYNQFLLFWLNHQDEGYIPGINLGDDPYRANPNEQHAYWYEAVVESSANLVQTKLACKNP